MKIPTLLGLTMLSILIIFGIGAKIYLDQTSNSPANLTTIQDLTQSNLSPTAVTISYNTNNPASTQLVYSTNKNLLENPKIAVDDDRDSQPTSRNLHFVTLQELNPATTYYFKVKINSTSFPDQPLTFTTPASDTSLLSTISTLVGTVINSNLQPVSEALVLLKSEGYLPLSAYTNSGGGFILSLRPLYKKDHLSEILKLPADKDAQLVISKSSLSSQIDIRLNQNTKLLPPIILGQNLDLRDYVASIEAFPKQASPSSQIYDFDVNGDGKINTADITIVINNLGRQKPNNPKADINKDGVVDQKDLDLIRNALPKN